MSQPQPTKESNVRNEQFREDLLDLIEQAKGRLPESDAQSGLRGGMRACYWPKSKRRWVLRGGNWGWDQMLQANGFKRTRTNQVRGGGYLTLVEVAS